MKISYYWSMMQAFRSLDNHLVFQSSFLKKEKEKEQQNDTNQLQHVKIEHVTKMISNDE